MDRFLKVRQNGFSHDGTLEVVELGLIAQHRIARGRGELAITKKGTSLGSFLIHAFQPSIDCQDCNHIRTKRTIDLIGLPSATVINLSTQ